MPTGKRVDPKVVQAAFKMKDDGKKPAENAEAFGCIRTWHYKVVKKYDPATGEPVEPKRRGRPRKADLAGVATIWGTTSALRHTTVDAIAKGVHDAGVNWSRATIHRRMVKKGIRSRPAVENVLTEPQREVRYFVASEMKRRLHEEARRVNHLLFTDEMRIDLKLKERRRVSTKLRFTNMQNE